MGRTPGSKNRKPNTNDGETRNSRATSAMEKKINQAKARNQAPKEDISDDEQSDSSVENELILRQRKRAEPVNPQPVAQVNQQPVATIPDSVLRDIDEISKNIQELMEKVNVRNVAPKRQQRRGRIQYEEIDASDEEIEEPKRRASKPTNMISRAVRERKQQAEAPPAPAAPSQPSWFR